MSKGNLLRQICFLPAPPADKSAGYEAAPRKRGLTGGFTRLLLRSPDIYVWVGAAISGFGLFILTLT